MSKTSHTQGDPRELMMDLTASKPEAFRIVWGDAGQEITITKRDEPDLFISIMGDVRMTLSRRRAGRG